MNTNQDLLQLLFSFPLLCHTCIKSNHLSGMVYLCIVLTLTAFPTFIFTHADFSYFKYNLAKVVVAFVLWKFTELSSRTLTFFLILIQFPPFSQDAVLSLKCINLTYSTFFTLSICLIKESPLCFAAFSPSPRHIFFRLLRIHVHFWVYLDLTVSKGMCDFHIAFLPTLTFVAMGVGGGHKKYFRGCKSLLILFFSFLKICQQIHKTGLVYCSPWPRVRSAKDPSHAGQGGIWLFSYLPFT